MTWHFYLESLSIAVTGSGQWTIDAWGTHEIWSSLNTDDVSRLSQLNRLPAVVGLYEANYLDHLDSINNIYEDYLVILEKFRAGKSDSIAIADAYDDSIGLAVFYQTQVFSSIKELTMFAIQTGQRLQLVLDFIGFGRSINAFTSTDYLGRRSVAAGIVRLALYSGSPKRTD